MNQVLKIVSSIMNIDISQLDFTSSPKSISSWDSLKHMKLVLALEEEFEIFFSDDEIIEITSIEKIIKTLGDKGISHV